MEKLLNRILIISIILFTGQGILKGQGTTEFNIVRNITLNGESEIKKTTLPVTIQYDELTIDITSVISEGELSIEIYDPVGENQGNFLISCQMNFPGIKMNKPNKDNNKEEPRIIGSPLGKEDSKYIGFLYNSENVHGQISRSVKQPLKGDWIIKIIPKNAKGTIRIETKQHAEVSSKE